MSSRSGFKTEIISIEGNIGSGKSTLVKILEENLAKMIEHNKAKLSKKTYKKKVENAENADIAQRSSLSDILMENYTINNTETADAENIEIDIGTNNNDNNDNNNNDNNDNNDNNLLKRIFKYIMQNAFGTRFVDWTKLKICFLPEPVDEWGFIVDDNGATILEKFYANQKKYAFPFQMMAYITRLKQLRKALSENYDIIITERCVHTDKEVFARMLYDSGKIEEIEYTIYNKWFEHFLEDIPKISIIYIQTEPGISHNRVIKRARPGEFISLEYLTECHNCHERWLRKYITDTSQTGNVIVNQNLLILNGNPNHEHNPEIINDWIQNIIEFIFKFPKN
jgi:deoxyguanosine kinase